MKKLLMTLIFAVTVLIIAASVTLYFSLNWIIKSGVESFGTRITGTEVKLEKSNISLLSGKMELKGLFIGNPEGFSTECAFKLHYVSVAIDIFSILSRTIIIDEIVVNAPEITYEVNEKGSNIKTILKNLKSFSRKSKSTSKGKVKKAKKEAEKKVLINRFMVKNGTVNFSMTALKEKMVSLSLPDITIENIGKGGKSASEILVEIFKVMTKNIDWAVSGSTRSLGQKTIDTLKGLFRN